MKFNFGAYILAIVFLAVACGPAEIAQDTPEDDEQFAQAQEIMMASSQALQSRLRTILNEQVVQLAIQYCSIEGNLLMDSLSQEYNAVISRVSHKNRNPDNYANQQESELIAEMLEMKERGESPMPAKFSSHGTNIYYFPIIINSEMCLSCHGVHGQDISDAANTHLQLVYPDDKATGFAMGDLRGLWKIQMQQPSTGL